MFLERPLIMVFLFINIHFICGTDLIREKLVDDAPQHITSRVSPVAFASLENIVFSNVREAFGLFDVTHASLFFGFSGHFSKKIKSFIIQF